MTYPAFCPIGKTAAAVLIKVSERRGINRLWRAHMSEEVIKNTGNTDFLTGKMKPLYFHYLTAAFGSALISSI